MKRLLWIAPLAVLMGCPTPEVSSSVSASDIAYNDQNVAIALANLEAQLLVEASKKEGGNAEDLAAEIAQLKKDVGILQEELTHIRTLLDQVQEGGIAHAKLIPFDPRVTTLKAQTLQEAIDEMMARVSTLESSVLDDLGQPGPGLFEIPRDKKGKQGPGNGQGPGGPPPNNGGPGQGPGGSPNQGPGGQNGQSGQGPGGPPPR